MKKRYHKNSMYMRIGTIIYILDNSEQIMRYTSVKRRPQRTRSPDSHSSSYQVNENNRYYTRDKSRDSETAFSEIYLMIFTFFI